MPTTYAIPDGRTVMAATTYTGTGSSLAVSNAVNGVSFQPDLVWIKARSNAYNNELYDVLRGVQKRLISNLTNAESTSTNGLTSFNSNGFTQGGETETGANGATYVAWQWKANGAGVTNTAGSITSQVSANTTAGFSVVTYTGTGANATVGHGLGVAPSFIIIKNRSSALNWICYHASLGNGNAIFLNLTNASSADTAWNNTSPTSTVFSLGSAATNANGSGNALVAYCFSAVAGYSAFGSYTGNGSADGPFVYLGFRPRWLMVKQSSAGGEDWVVSDGARDPINVVDSFLAPNSSSAEATGSGAYVDYLSNGFKVRTDNPRYNGSGATYIYACFAENPFKYANAR